MTLRYMSRQARNVHKKEALEVAAKLILFNCMPACKECEYWERTKLYESSDGGCSKLNKTTYEDFWCCEFIEMECENRRKKEDKRCLKILEEAARLCEEDEK